MSLDLEERLAAYGPMLESAIGDRAADATAARPPSRKRTWIVTAMAAAAVVAGVVGLVVVRPASTPDSQAPADGPVPDPPDEIIPTTMALPPPPPAPTASTVVTPPPAPSGSTLPATAPPPPTANPVIAIGDSVMLGAARQLAERGIIVDAHESRQVIDAVELVEQLRDNDQLGDAVVVHVGTSGTPTDATLDAFFAPLTDVPKVIVLTAYVDRSWTDETNLRLHAAAQRFPNIEILDWAVLTEQCPGDCFWDDSYHLNPAGRTYYADLIVNALQP
ncbi:MAG: hypothetical protein ACR2HQ_07420 [Ilumatobacteraceae bacterium]